MTDYTIEPPQELVEEWVNDWANLDHPNPHWYPQYIANRAALWAASQELNACCEEIEKGPFGFASSAQEFTDWLRSVRRPKEPSLKEQALAKLENLANWDRRFDAFNKEAVISYNTVRRALESLPDE